MPEQFRDKLLRNLMPYPATYRFVGHLASLAGPTVALPSYVKRETPYPIWRKTPSVGPVFVTARFRTGSTLVWQCFNRLDDFEAFYEPFNERQWFDPAKRGDKVDSSHRGVDDYASNYHGLSDLGKYYRTDWTTRELLMGAGHKNNAMLRYIERLFEASENRAVLQFNRIDFRLEFLRSNFPEASFIYLNRNPRNTWRSTLKGVANDPSWNLLTFQQHCRFYLLPWYRDLALSFPWIVSLPKDTHPYQIHYLIHRLSELFARNQCDIFVDYEDMEKNLAGVMESILVHLGHTVPDMDVVEALSRPRQSQYEHGEDVGLYQELEQHAEELLSARLPKDD